MSYPNDPNFSGAPMGTAVPEYPEPRTSGAAIASLVVAIIGLFLIGIVLGPIAICLAVSAKNDIRARPDEVKGEGLANAGLVIGVVGTVISVIFIIAVLASG